MPRPCSIQASGFSDRLAGSPKPQAAVRFHGQEQLVTSTEVQSPADLGRQNQQAAVA